MRVKIQWTPGRVQTFLGLMILEAVNDDRANELLKAALDRAQEVYDQRPTLKLVEEGPPDEDGPG